MNKYLIQVKVPFLEKTFDVLVPVTKKIGVIREYLLEGISEYLEISLDTISDYNFYNSDTGNDYDEDKFIKDTDIKNGTILLLM